MQSRALHLLNSVAEARTPASDSRMEKWAQSMASDAAEQIESGEISSDEGEVYDYLKTNYRADSSDWDEGYKHAFAILREKGVL